jgi:hypothetical protein
MILLEVTNPCKASCLATTVGSWVLEVGQAVVRRTREAEPYEADVQPQLYSRMMGQLRWNSRGKAVAGNDKYTRYSPL